jgi:protein phosphatase
MEAYPDSSGMGTTCIVMMRTQTKLGVANIGDSRAYLLRNGRLTQITKDHSFVQKLLDEGRIGPEEALHHPQRSLVTRVLTGRPEDRPDLSLRELRQGDRLLLCSDGLTDYAAEETVGEILAQTDRTPGQVADELIQLALRASTRDNVTVIVADAVPGGTGTTKPQVVGAASERRSAPSPQALTPAEKAALLSREASGTQLVEGPVLAEEGSTHPVLRWLRRSLVAAAVLAVLGAAGWLGWAWSQDQYYVGEQDGRVTIFRGLAQDLGPLQLGSAEEQTDLALEDLPTFYQDRVEGTLAADDREAADTIVAELRLIAAGRQDALSGGEAPTTASPTTASPTTDASGSTTDSATSTDDAATTGLPAGHPLAELLETAVTLGEERP